MWMFSSTARSLKRKKDVTLHWKGSANQRVIDVKKSLAQGSVVLYESK